MNLFKCAYESRNLSGFCMYPTVNRHGKITSTNKVSVQFEDLDFTDENIMYVEMRIYFESFRDTS